MEKTIYEQAIEKFGVEKQTDMLIEEMAELTQALLKHRRKPSSETSDNLHEEFADVQIMMSQIRTIINPDEVDRWHQVKLDRLQLLIER